MFAASSVSGPALIAFQIALALGACAVFALAPPARGAITIVSLAGEDDGTLARWSVAHGAQLLGTGPLPHSLVVRAERAGLTDAARAHRAILLGGAAAGCGEGGIS